jgi:ABC-type Fe3+-siderophore transport system permease subunit
VAERRPIDVAVLKLYGAMAATTVAFMGPIALWVGLTADDGASDRQPPYLNVALVVTWLIAIAVTVAIFEYCRRRPVDKPATWGEAMAGATVVFFLLFWIWGVVPHQWLTFADNELGWREDRFLVGPAWGPDGQNLLSWLLPFDLTYLVVRDIIAVSIYGVTIAGFIWAFVIWQNRGKVAPAEVVQSTYGRPIVREGV